MTDFFINHTRRFIVRAEADAGFNITKNLRLLVSRYSWNLDDHIEFANSDKIAHPYGVKLLIQEKYILNDWMHNARFFLNTASEDYRLLMLEDYAGPFGV